MSAAAEPVKLAYADQQTPAKGIASNLNEIIRDEIWPLEQASEAAGLRTCPLSITAGKIAEACQILRHL
jgi:D-mannonate dehydratase